MRVAPSLGLLAAIVLGTSVHGQTVLTPIPGYPHSAGVTTDVSGFSAGYGATILGGSSLTVTHDAAAGSIAIDAIDLRLSSATACVGVHFCQCYRNQRFRLGEGVRPVAALAPDGRFEMTHAAVYEGESGGGFPFCGAEPRAAIDVTWHAAGTLAVDPATGAIAIAGLAVSVDGTGDIDAASLSLTVSSAFQVYEPLRAYQDVGAPLVITGGGITPGTVAKVFINTVQGPRDVTPDGLRPTSTTPVRWEGTLPWPWPLPAPHDADLGAGFLSAHLVRTDRGYDRSGTVSRVLTGNPALGVPRLLRLSLSSALSPTSWDPAVAVANMAEVYAPGGVIELVGSFPHPAATVVNVFGADGNCAPPGGVLPTRADAYGLEIRIPAGCPIGPGSMQAVDTVTWRASNAISAPLGEPVDVSAVTIGGTGVRVTGTGFGRRTVVNFFARDATGALVNFGGFDSGGLPRIPVVVTDAHALAFELPAGVTSGGCFVEALNPPFIDFTSSRSRPPGGACTVP